MKSRLIIFLLLALPGPLLAGVPDAYIPPRQLTNIWEYIKYPFPTADADTKDPIFLISSGAQYDQVSLGLRLDVNDIAQGFGFFKTNGLSVRLYRADGEIVEPTTEGKKLLKEPISTSWAAHLPNGEYAPGVTTFFPWGTNALAESWLEVSIATERYWLEIPYGFDRNPMDPPAPASFSGPPQCVSAMKSLNVHDHVVRWQNVHYNLGVIQNGWRLTLIQSNPFDAASDVELYHDPGMGENSWELYSPKTALRIQDADGTVLDSHCINLHLNDDNLRRTDTFVSGRYGTDKRSWGQIEISVDDKTYRVAVPSSLYKYTHGHAP